MNHSAKIRTGVIGVGVMGVHHARVYARLPGVELCAIADADIERARAAAARFGARAYSDFGQMLEREQLDAVTVAVPTSAHLSVARAVIAHGINLLVEKPLAATVHEAEEIVRAANAAGVVLAVGHIERFNPAVGELAHQIHSGALGAISSVIARRVGVMPPRVQDADVVIDLAVHDIDVLNYLFGELPQVVGASGGHALLAQRYDHAEMFLRYGGAGCFVQVNWITPLKIRTLSVTGESGHAELNYVTQKLEIYESNVAREYNDFGDFVVRFGEARRTAIPVEVREPLQIELENFIAAVRGEPNASVSGHDGVNALTVAAQVLECIKYE